MVNTEWYTQARVDELLAEKDAEIADLRAKVEAVCDVVDDLGTAPRHWECNAKLRAVLEGGR